jgi:glucosyl-dolichyl phosphate glucuronosyltransferase
MSRHGAAFDVSVVVPTRNRSALLRAALDSLLAQRAAGVRYEVLVVDNNSTDDTARTVAACSDSGQVRYLFEPSQGPSCARNRGIQASTAPIVAFTDDDVRASPSWVARLKSVLDQHADVDCIGGKVLPEWPSEPPDWLTTAHWAPLALLDYGPVPVQTGSAPRRCLLTANMAVRRAAIARVGDFDRGYLRCQDHELQIRLWKAGCQCLYDPDLVVVSPVEVERLTKRYMRLWYRQTATYHARMPPQVLFDLPGEAPLILNVPRFLYRQLAEETASWIADVFRKGPTTAFLHETRIRYLAAYLTQRWRQKRASGPRRRAE